ncbi:bifunctional diguanylate cyclase/phosphodiesterase [Novosphingobium sp. PhB165]|uniref:putative bifunctional diguanylate cyclase/phosphodiesterase n=1 Tax=Novosphingobium sp. PhB165 TaxID=2485105 RepID=UPI0014050D15|nr:bifunctional diguanylate cyclase/phosphodiesterase [Novosphingobium sp. PhB165]
MAFLRGDDGAPQPLSLLILDLDRFKLVNDLCGHAAGDEVIAIAAGRCGRIAAKVSGRVVHVGGDEFACVLPLNDGADLSEAVAADLLDVLASPIVLGRHMIHLTASIGIASDPSGTTTPERLLRGASIAMSRAKASGGAAVRRFTPEMLATLTDRAALEEALRSALLRGELVPHYQPIVALPSRKIARFEVLARWEHPHRGLLGPDLFLQVGEDLRLIDDMLFGLLRQACRNAREWPDEVGLSVNMSPQQVCDPGVAARLLQIVFACGLPPERLTVEITENAMVDNLADARATIDTLRGAGARIALDDFGTGYASLARLCHLPLDTIKIDRTLIQALDSDPGRKLVNTVLDLGRSLGMPVTAEGIETEEQARFLVERGCAFGQGFLFGRAAPASATLGMLEKVGSPDDEV